MSIFTLSFSARCFWSIIRSLSTHGDMKVITDIEHRKTSNPMAETEMQAPETVPSLY